MIHTTSPITATTDQRATILALEAVGVACNVDVDAGQLDIDATDPCDNDTTHGPGVVCTPHGRLCLRCAALWLWWMAGETVALDVLRDPTTPGMRAAA